MVDVFDKQTRSKIMSKIRGKNTKPELILRKALYSKGYRYRIHHKINGCISRPDIVFIRKKIAIFVDGEFWHGKDWEKQKKKLDKQFWIDKIERNMERDKEADTFLKKDGWIVLRFWSKDIEKDLDDVLSRIERYL